MRASKIVQVTVTLDAPEVALANPPARRLVALFTRVPTRNQLIEAFEHKAELFEVIAKAQGIINVDFEPLRLFLRAIPTGDIKSTIYPTGMLAVDVNEPLFMP